MPDSTRRDLQTPLAVTMLVVGALLLAFMVTTEGEPGALPLALLAGGAIWLVVARRRGRRRADDDHG